MDNQTAGVDLDSLTRYDHQGCIMTPDATGDYLLVADVREALTRRAEPSVAADERATFPAYKPSAERVLQLIDEARQITDISSSGPIPLTLIQIGYIVGHVAAEAARAALASPAVSQKDAPEAPANAWHDAILAECMRVESCYHANDPVKTIKELINWYTEEASGVAEGIKIMADNYMRETCGTPSTQQPVSQMDGAAVVFRNDGKEPDWAHIPPAFNDWWNKGVVTSTNPFTPDSAAYWAWEGWQAAATTASASIKYDGQFNALLMNYGVAIATGDDGSEAYKKIVAHLDSRAKAPSQSASASKWDAALEAAEDTIMHLPFSSDEQLKAFSVARRAVNALKGRAQAPSREVCAECGSARPLHDLDCSVAQQGASHASNAGEDTTRDEVLIKARDAINGLLWQFTSTPSTYRDSNARAQGHEAVKAIDAAIASSAKEKKMILSPSLSDKSKDMTKI